MRILYFLDLPFDIGGANKVLMTQAYILKGRGFQVKVVIPNDEMGQHSSEYDAICESCCLNVTTECYHISTCIEAIDILTALQEYEAISKLIKSYKPDLIHSTQLNIAVELAARELKIPHLMNIYQVDEQAFFLDWLKVFPQYHSADSKMMCGRWGNGLKIPSHCIRVAYTFPLSKDIQKKDELSKGKLLHIVSIGVVYENKNQLEIIKFILKCKENGYNVNLTLLGDCRSAYADTCKKFVQENGLSRNVFFMGFISHIEDYLQKADLFILASLVESYPGVIVESMANKIPIISTPVAGVPELLRDGENGFLTDGYKAENIYQTFLRYVEYCKEGKILNVVQNAYDTYLENHTYVAVEEQLASYYQWIIWDYNNRKDSNLTYKEVKNIIDNFIDQNKIDRANQFYMRNIWFLYHIITILENKKIVIWGAGFWGSIALEWLKLLQGKFEFIGFIDTNKSGEYLNYPILLSKEEVILECDIVLVAVADTQARLEIINYLEKYGKVRNKNYFMLYNSPIRI